MGKAKARDSALATVNAAPGPLVFEVIGRPVPKGSATAFAFADKITGKPRAVVTQGKGKQRSALAEYAANVREEAYRAIGRCGRGRELDGGPRFVGHALTVELEFRLARPKAHFRTGKKAHLLRDDAPARPEGTPDIDKLARSTLDALTGIVFDDDKRVARLVCDKFYAEREGVRIRVAALAALAVPVVSPLSPDDARSTGTALGESVAKVIEASDRNAKLRAAAGPVFAAERELLADSPPAVDPTLDELDFG